MLVIANLFVFIFINKYNIEIYVIKRSSMQLSINKANFDNFNNYARNPKAHNITANDGFVLRNVELPNCELGQAICNYNNISFKQVSTAKEITYIYKNKNNSCEQLAKPNIRVYEYPDTKLQLFVNELDNSNDDEFSLPIYTILVENNDYDKHDLLKEKLLFLLLNKRNPDIVNSSFCFSLSAIGEEDLLDKISDMNKDVFGLKIKDEEFQAAKKELNAFIKSPEYTLIDKKNEILYDKEDLKTVSELQEEIKNITQDDMQKYYEEYLQHSSARVFLTTTREYFDNNKKNILKRINPNLKARFVDGNFARTNSPQFINNTAIIDKAVLKIPTKASNTKESLIEEIAIGILNSDKDFREKYLLETKGFLIPLSLKNNVPIKYHSNFCTVTSENNNGNFTDFYETLNAYCDKNLKQDVENKKNDIKMRFEQIFAEPDSVWTKHLVLLSYSDEIFNLNEIIDSIQDDDIKQYYKNLINVIFSCAL